MFWLTISSSLIAIAYKIVHFKFSIYIKKYVYHSSYKIVHRCTGTHISKERERWTVAEAETAAAAAATSTLHVTIDVQIQSHTKIHLVFLPFHYFSPSTNRIVSHSIHTILSPETFGLWGSRYIFRSTISKNRFEFLRIENGCKEKMVCFDIIWTKSKSTIVCIMPIYYVQPVKH